MKLTFRLKGGEGSGWFSPPKGTHIGDELDGKDSWAIGDALKADRKAVFQHGNWSKSAERGYYHVSAGDVDYKLKIGKSRVYPKAGRGRLREPAKTKTILYIELISTEQGRTPLYRTVYQRNIRGEGTAATEKVVKATKAALSYLSKRFGVVDIDEYGFAR